MRPKKWKVRDMEVEEVQAEEMELTEIKSDYSVQRQTSSWLVRADREQRLTNR